MENNVVTSFSEKANKLMYPIVFGGIMKRHYRMGKQEKRTVGVQCNLDEEKNRCEVGVQFDINVPEWVLVDD